MLRRMAEDLSLMMISNKVIKIEEREFYIYGIELFICNLFILATILILSFITNMVLVSVIYSAVFCILRVYAGGHHCKTYLRCFFTSVGIYIGMLVTGLLLVQQKNVLTLILLLIFTPFIFLFAPVDTSENPLEIQDKIRCRRVTVVLTIIFSSVSVLGLFFRQVDIAYAITCAMAAISSQILISKMRSVKNEKRNPKNCG